MTGTSTGNPPGNVGREAGVPRKFWMTLGLAFPGLLLLIRLHPAWRAIPQVSVTLLLTAVLLAV